jgi:hypothetical protein
MQSFSRIAAFVVALVGFGVAQAATQGTLGPTSTGTSNLSITVGNAAQISNMNDFALGLWAGGNVTAADSVCVYTNTAGGGYTITPSSANAGGTGLFRLTNGAAAYLPYAVGWTGVSNSNFAASTCVGGGGACAGSGVVSAGQTGADTTSRTCGGGTSATLSVELLATDLSAAAPGNWTDTLTIVVTPQ